MNYTYTNPYRLELTHHGVLGMKWGVRRENKDVSSMSNRQKRKVTKSMTKIDDGDLKKAKEHFVEINNLAASRITGDLKKLNKKWEGKYESHKEAYYKEYYQLWDKQVTKAGKELSGTTTSSGRVEYTWNSEEGSFPYMTARYTDLGDKQYKELAHAKSEDNDSIEIRYVLDVKENGEIIGFVEDAVLEHYGILGMKWGVRRGRNASGKNLSNEQLNTAVRRLELEKRYSQLTKKEKTAAAKWTKNILIGSATAVATKYTTDYMSKQVGSMIKKKAAEQLQFNF